MKTHVIILCQGQQSRLPMLPVAKQLLPLPACGETPILHRTIRQLWRSLGLGTAPGGPAASSLITVVASLAMAEQLVQHGAPVTGPTGIGVRYHPDVQTLPDPGNSSLRGIARYLELPESAKPARDFDRVVVLLGDVIYSWKCLRAIFGVGPPYCIRFVGSSDLSRSGGELWGLSWTWEGWDFMRLRLADALAKHPPFDGTYQPGQMRRWLWAVDAGYANTIEVMGREYFTPVDDYTKDIDLPEHLAFIPALSEQARLDDEREGVLW